MSLGWVRGVEARLAEGPCAEALCGSGTWHLGWVDPPYCGPGALVLNWGPRGPEGSKHKVLDGESGEGKEGEGERG